MGVLLLLVGVAVLGFGLFQHLKGKRILAAPFKKTGELVKNPVTSDPKGAISTEGKVIAPAEALLSPCTKQPCLAYEVKVERLWEKVETTQDGTKTVKGSDTLDTLKGGTVFGLDDGSGALQIDVTTGADFDNYKDGYKKELNGRGWASQVQFGELSFDVPVISDSEKYTIGFKATERYVPVEGSLFVLGKLEGAKIVKPGWRSLMTSAKGRDGLIGSINKKKKFSFIGGGVAAVLAVPLMIFGPSGSDGTGGASAAKDPNHTFGGGCASSLTGAVSKCSDRVSTDSGESYTWTVTRKDTYALTVTPAKGKKYQLDAELIVERDGEYLVREDAGAGSTVKASVELEPGTYTISVKDLSGYIVKGGYSFDLEIVAQHPEPAEAPAVAAKAAPSKKDALKAKLAAKKGKPAPAQDEAPAVPNLEPVAEAPSVPADPFAVRAHVASCNLPANGSCSEYAKDSEASRKGCELFKGTYATSACPRANVVAACALTKQAGDVNFIYAGGPLGITSKSAGMMCPSNLGTLALAPESPAAQPAQLAAVEPVAMPEVDLSAAEEELEISARRLTQLAVELNQERAGQSAGRFAYIFTNVSCDKSARWCQLDVTAMERATHQPFVSVLPFTPASKTRAAFTAATEAALSAFERAPQSGRLSPVVLSAEAKPVAVAKKAVIVEPLSKPAAQPAPSRPVAVAPKEKPAPAPVVAAPAPVKAAPAKASAAPAPVMQRANKNMAD